MPRILRKRLYKKVFALFLCLPLCGHYLVKAQVSGTYTINSTLPTGGTNFNSFTAALAYLQTGLSGPVVFNVAAGTGPYNEQIYLGNAIGTTAANTLTFNCNGVTLSFASSNTSSRAGVKLENIGYVTFDNLKITPTGLYGYGFHLLNNADNNVIQNCQITLPTHPTTPANNEGIVINGSNDLSTAAGTSNCDNNTIRNNTISGGNAGITLSSVPVSGNPAVLMQGNKILNNTISDSYASCIQLWYNDGAIVDGNDLQGGPHATKNVMGIYLNRFDQNVKVINNKIHNFHITDGSIGSFIYGIFNSAQGAAGNVNLFASNLIYDFSSSGYQHGISSRFAAASYFNIYHNTISLDDQTIFGRECDGLYFENVSDVNVWNNIITISRKTRDWNYCFKLVKTMTRLTSNRNVFQVSGANYYNAIGELANRRLDSLPLWQQVTELDYSSVYEDPKYTNLAGFNFVPTGQPIDNMAMVVGVTTDIIGATRSSLNPDPGCYEFVTPACQTPVKPGISKVLPDSVLCYGPTVALGLKNNSWGVGQTYTWQSATSPTGTYTDISSGLAYPAFDIMPATTTYYRAAVTCLGNTMYSAPIRVIIHTKLTAGTYTINATQPTGGINFTSFSDAVLAMQCGVTGPVVFNVAPNTGPYNEQLSLPSINNTASETIVFKGNGDTLAFEANTNERAVVKLNGIDYVTIDSLNIKVTGSSYGYGVHLMGDADHNTIQKCNIIMPADVTSTGYAGIVINNNPSNATDINTVSFADSNTIVNNTITGGYYGITCTSKALVAPFPLGNTFTGNKIMDACTYGIYLDGVAKCIVDSNDISQPARTVFKDGFNGIYVKQSSSGVGAYGMQISRNKVHDLLFGNTAPTIDAHGIHFELVPGSAANPGAIYNNVMYNFWGDGRQYGLYSRNSNHLKIYHNTISLDDSTAAPISGVVTIGYGLIGSAATVGVEFINNNVTIRRGGLTTRTGLSILANDPNLKANYNNYLITPATGLNYTGSQAGINYVQLSDWTAAVKKDTNSVSIDPGYVNVPGGDLTPGNVPFENKGIALPAVPRDINDSTRNVTKPDLGAHEFTICYPLGPLVVIIDSVGGNTIRFAWKPVANATAYLVSRNGINWLTPSSGKLGTTHIVTGLNGLDTTGLIVKALGTRYDCPPQISPRIKSQTLSDDVFFPNMFSPNGNGVDDEFKVYSNVVKSMRLMIFNQWGQKVFETSDVAAGWDGTYQGKPQPVGVYVYVATLRLNDNTTITKKGTLNLIR